MVPPRFLRLWFFMARADSKVCGNAEVDAGLHGSNATTERSKLPAIASVSHAPSTIVRFSSQIGTISPTGSAMSLSRSGTVAHVSPSASSPRPSFEPFFGPFPAFSTQGTLPNTPSTSGISPLGTSHSLPPTSTAFQEPSGVTSLCEALDTKTTTTSPQPTLSSSFSGTTKTTILSHHAVVALASVFAAAAICVVLLLALLCIRRKRSRRVHAEKIGPSVDDVPAEYPRRSKPRPSSGTEWLIVLPQLLQGGDNRRASYAGSLMGEIFPLPCEVEDVRRRLQTLSAQADSLTVRSRSGAFSQTLMENLQAGIAALRQDVDRMKRYSMRSGRRLSSRISLPRLDSRSSDMLSELALLRLEIEEMLGQAQARSERVRPDSLPSYTSQYAVKESIFYEQLP